MFVEMGSLVEDSPAMELKSREGLDMGCAMVLDIDGSDSSHGSSTGRKRRLDAWVSWTISSWARLEMELGSAALSFGSLNQVQWMSSAVV